jgi:hypothetical protein
MSPDPKWKSFKPSGTAMMILLTVAGIFYIGYFSKPPAEKGGGCLSLTTAWFCMMALLVLLCVVLGFVISKQPLGILVNNRNLMSLSRFQTVAWSVVILAAVLTIAFRRIFSMGDDPHVLDIAMDKHLWALLGISMASLVGTPLILQNKTSKDPDPKAVAQTQTALAATGQADPEINTNRQGTLYVNPSVADARITDMFQGDEVGNTAYVDIAKVQMFLFTIITIMAYCYAIYTNLANEKLEMPALSEGMIAMLGISHAGYLGSKTADHTPTK